MSLNLEEIREKFPITRNYNFMNHAAVAPMSRPAAEAMCGYATELSGAAYLQGTYYRAAERVRLLAARLIHADPAEITFTKNTSEGVNYVAGGVQWVTGDNIVSTSMEFPANVYPWLALQPRGVTLRSVAEEEGRVVGLASGTYLGNVNLGVIGYLAADRTTRSRGVGTRLRGHLRRRFARDAKRITGGPLEGIIGEVSADNPWLRALARRPEVLVLDFQYYQPRLYDDDEPSPFVLYYECLTRVRDRIPVKELRRILYTIWRRIYRVSRPVDRRAFRAMLRALENRRTIGRRRTSN